MPADNGSLNDSVIRIAAAGRCEGFDGLWKELAADDRLELVARLGAKGKLDVLREKNLDVVLYAIPDGSLPRDRVTEIQTLTEASVIVVAGDEAPVLLDEALELGAADVVLPDPVENVLFAIRKAMHVGPSRSNGHLPSGAARTVTVFSPKGGVGKTVVSVNLALALAARQKETLLVDLDLQFGDAAIMLGLEPEKTLADLLVAPGELDADKLRGFTSRHPSGLDLLPAPVRPEDAELITQARLSRLFEVAKEAYDVVVVDTSPAFGPPLLTALDHTDDLLVVSYPEVPSLKNVRLTLEILDLLGLERPRVSVLLNCAGAKAAVSSKEAAQVLRRDVRFEVPYDSDVPKTVNRGCPILIAKQKSDFTKTVTKIAHETLNGNGRNGGRRRLLAKDDAR